MALQVGGMPARPKHIFEYLVVRGLGVPFRWLPYRMALGLGWGVAWFGFYVMRFRREEACRRIREVFGDRHTEKETQNIAWTSFRNQVFNAVESERIRRIGPDWVERHIDNHEAMAKLKQHVPEGSGAIYALPHMGNWDLTGIVGRLEGLPLFYLSRRQKNPLVTNYLFKQRMNDDTEVLDRDDPGMLRKTVRLLREGKQLAMTVDVRNRAPGTVYQYLGKPAQLVEGSAVFAKMAKVPIIPFVVIREGWTQHKWFCLDPVLPDPERPKKEDIARMMQTVLDGFSKYALAHPEQFYWINKRWVLELHEETEQAMRAEALTQANAGASDGSRDS